MGATDTTQRLDRIFHGREEELAALRDWVAADHPPGNRTGLVIGAPGRGKSALLTKFAEQCANRADDLPSCYIQSLDVTGHQVAAEVMSHLLSEMLAQHNRPIKRGPRDRNGLKMLLETIPQIGKLLAHFVREDTRPGWQKFLDFATQLSNAIPRKRLPEAVPDYPRPPQCPPRTGPGCPTPTIPG